MGKRFVSTVILTSLLVACHDDAGFVPRAKADAADGGSSDAAAAVPAINDVGTATVHRLNAVEYDNTIRDLLGDDRHFGASFPPDDGADSFTNNADSLTISPLLFEQYEAAADALATTALDNPDIVPCEGTVECATDALSRLARRAWRRPVEPAEVDKLVALVTGTQSKGYTFRDGLKAAIEAILLSPKFLFRIEADDVDVAHAITDHELASRLSYFLWSTMPDPVLSAYADAGKLHEDRIFDLQVKRMLADPKAGALLDNFAKPWLVHGLTDANPDVTLFPSFDANLRASMAGETRAYLGSFVFGDQSLADMLDANFTYLDARMAQHYGIPGITGTDFVRVDVTPETHRGGLLTHASILTMTSVATRTSPVRRGEWVLAELLCSPPPPPPADVPSLEGTITTGTMRQRMEAHRANPACASCHTQMDPIGFSLENFDAIGRWRETDANQPIDTTGVLPNGTPLTGEADLANAIKTDPRFARCATGKLYSYALGRVAQPYDEPRLAALTGSFVKDGFRTRKLIDNIVHSDAFRMRRPGK